MGCAIIDVIVDGVVGSPTTQPRMELRTAYAAPNTLQTIARNISTARCANGTTPLPRPIVETCEVSSNSRQLQFGRA